MGMMQLLLFLSSGLFLGWSLGANDAANIFGTAVGAGMLRFRTAALIASIFVIIGATISGAGAAHTLGSLGAVNALAGSFTVALSAALTVFWMTKLKLPVSTSQAIVGAIIGWNLYTGLDTNPQTLSKILGTWVICPLLAAFFAVLLSMLANWALNRVKLHLLYQDKGLRIGLLLVGAFGAYSLGANNIANVMGVFVPSNPFDEITLFGSLHISGTQQLFFLGGVAIALGIFTYSERVMRTVGKDLLRLSPVAALIVVLSQSLVLFLFASEHLESFLLSHGLPAIPLVPVSSSQAVVGAVIGVGLVKGGGRNIRFRILGEISVGWLSTPIAAGVLSFFSLFFINNVFNQTVYVTEMFRIDEPALVKLGNLGYDVDALEDLKDIEYVNQAKFKRSLKKYCKIADKDVQEVMYWTVYKPIVINKKRLASIDAAWLGEEKTKALESLLGYSCVHPWQLADTLAESSPDWRVREVGVEAEEWNRQLFEKQKYIIDTFSTANR